MDTSATEQIIKRVYEIWEKNNKPEGRDEEFYHQAEQELRNEDKPSPLSHTRKPVTRLSAYPLVAASNHCLLTRATIGSELMTREAQARQSESASQKYKNPAAGGRATGLFVFACPQL
jgi:hypothetical protein